MSLSDFAYSSDSECEHIIAFLRGPNKMSDIWKFKFLSTKHVLPKLSGCFEKSVYRRIDFVTSASLKWLLWSMLSQIILVSAFSHL